MEVLGHLFQVLLVLQKDLVEFALGVLEDIYGIVVDI